MATLTDAQLHELAKKRVDFRAHLIVFVVINSILWTIWWLTGHGYMWPIWPLAGWGIGLIFHYLFDYHPSRLLNEEEEYERLKRELGERNQTA